MKVFFHNAHRVHANAMEGRVLKPESRDTEALVFGTKDLQEIDFQEYNGDYAQEDIYDIARLALGHEIMHPGINCFRYAISGVFTTVMKVDTLTLIKLNVLSPTPFAQLHTGVPTGCCKRCLVALPIGRVCTLCKAARRNVGLGCSLTTKIVTQSKRKHGATDSKTPKSFTLSIRNGNDARNVEREVLYFNPGVVSLLFHPSDKRMIKGDSLSSLDVAALNKKTSLPVATSVKDAVWQFAEQRDMSNFPSEYKANVYHVFKHWTIPSFLTDEPETEHLVPEYKASALIVLLSVPTVKYAAGCFVPMPIV